MVDHSEQCIQIQLTHTFFRASIAAGLDAETPDLHSAMKNYRLSTILRIKTFSILLATILASIAQAGTVYMCDLGQNVVWGLQTAPDGSFTSKYPFTGIVTGSAPFQLVKDPVAPVLYTANAGEHTASVIQINLDGTITLASKASTVVYSPTSIAVTANGKFAYVGSQGPIYEYSVAADGSLLPIGTTRRTVAVARPV